MVTETREEFMARLYPEGKETCDGCGRKNETGESFHYRSFLKHFCTPCAKSYDMQQANERMLRVQESGDDEPDDAQHTDEIVCPYCGYEHHDSWEMSDSGKTECSSCERKFSYEREYEVTYSTKRLDTDE